MQSRRDELLALAEKVRARAGARAWEPIDIHHPAVKQLIQAGWLVRCTMRCGFEAFDTGVKWSSPAEAYFALAAEQDKTT